MGQDTYFCQRLNYAHYFGIRPSPSLTFTVLCPFFWIASTFPFVLLYAWIHIVWSPSHLSAPSCVSTCVAYIEDMMLLQFCTCVMTAFFRSVSTAAWKNLRLRADLTLLINISASLPSTSTSAAHLLGLTVTVLLTSTSLMSL